MTEEELKEELDKAYDLPFQLRLYKYFELIEKYNEDHQEELAKTWVEEVTKDFATIDEITLGDSPRKRK